MEQRAILSPTLEVVDKMNAYVMSTWPGEELCYVSSDSICKVDTNSSSNEDAYTPEFLNVISTSELPNYKLTLKVGVPVMLLRNIDQFAGLCNGTRLIVSRLERHMIEAEIITGNNVGGQVFIPRLVLTPLDIKLPFQLQRRQFPVSSFLCNDNQQKSRSISLARWIISASTCFHSRTDICYRFKSYKQIRIKDSDMSQR